MADKNRMVVEKMLKYAEKVLRYTEGLDYAQFAADTRTVDACVFNISQLGELTRHMDKDYRDSHPAMPWYNIYNLRNRIVHDYEGIKLDVLWQVIYYHLPPLRDQLEELLKEARP